MDNKKFFFTTLLGLAPWSFIFSCIGQGLEEIFINLVKINGYLIYETFAVGNEKYGKPSNRKFLLKNNELKSLLTDNFKILDFYEGYLSKPKSSVKQRCIAKRVV